MLFRSGGTIHAWHPLRQTDLSLTFQNLEIPEYSPYTVQFAGYRIAGGTMDLELGYRLNNRELEGRNRIVLRELELGEKMASSNATDLPLELAIALLKDREGVIDLEIPVSGDVDKPEFDIGKVVRQALSKTLTSVVESPFRFLAGLVGADSEELGHIRFPPGRSDLTPPQRERVAGLRKALNQRPGLVLELAGPFSAALDGGRLRREKAIEALQQKLAETGREIADPSLTAEATQEAVEALFTGYYPEKELQAVRARFTQPQEGASDREVFDGLAYRNYLADEVVAAQPVDEADLRAFANQRADAVRRSLVHADGDDGVAGERVRILEPRAVEPGEGDGVTMEVGLVAE